MIKTNKKLLQLFIKLGGNFLSFNELIYIYPFSIYFNIYYKLNIKTLKN